MARFPPVTISRELRLSSNTDEPAQSLSAQTWAQSCSLLAIRLQSSVLLASLPNLDTQQSLQLSSTETQPKQCIQGISLNPHGQWLAAFTAEALYLAAVPQPLEPVGRLQLLAPLSGIKSLCWCPQAPVLAVLQKQQAGLKLVQLQDGIQQQQRSRGGSLANGSTSNSNKHSQHNSTATAPPPFQPPIHLLPGPGDVSTAARCAAWLPCTKPYAACLLVAWPADMLMYTWAAMQSQQGGLDWHQHQLRCILTGWRGPVRALAAAAAAGAAPEGLTSTSLGASSDASCLILGTVDAQLSLGSQGNNTLSVLDSSVLQPAADRHPSTASAAEEVSGQINAADQSAAAAVEPSPTTKLNILASADQGLQPAKPSLSTCNGAGVLGSLINISAQQSVLLEPDSSRDVGLHGRDTSSGNVQHSHACLCLLQVSLSDLHNRGCPNDRDSGSTGGHSREQKSRRSQDRLQPSQFSSVLELPTGLSLPDILAVSLNSSIVAVASSKGPPIVTVCSFSSQQGLQQLLTVSVPMPAVAAPWAARLRLKGLAFVGNPTLQQQQQRQQQPVSIFSSSTPAECQSNGENNSNGPGAHSEQWQLQSRTVLPEFVAIVTCSGGERQPGGCDTGTQGDLYLLNCQGPPAISQQQRMAQDMPQQQNISMHHHHQPHRQQQQPAIGQQNSAESALVAALKELQASLEYRLDAMHHTITNLATRLGQLESHSSEHGNGIA